MSKILLAEDNLAEAVLVSGILRNAGYEVVRVPDGAKALEKIAELKPALVVTDLQMPDMDGLQLIEQVRCKYPFLPVVLITSHGSEEIAVDALNRGAASYVPKSIVHRELVTVVDDVLAAATAQRQYEVIKQHLVHRETHYNLPTDPELIAPLCEQIQENLRQLQFGAEIELVRIGVAMREALVNAIHHGSLEVSSELRREDDRPYFDQIRIRLKEPPYCERRIYVQVKQSRSAATFVVRDEGPGFDPRSIPDPRELVHVNRPYGRGLVLIRAFMDQVRHNATGNEITMTKTTASAGAYPITNAADN